MAPCGPVLPAPGAQPDTSSLNSKKDREIIDFAVLFGSFRLSALMLRQALSHLMGSRRSTENTPFSQVARISPLYLSTRYRTLLIP